MIHALHDTRTDCYSLLTSMSIRQYLELVREAHERQGGIEGQRGVLATTTARRIRERMISDLGRGAVLPPLVVGAIVPNETWQSLSTSTDELSAELLSAGSLQDISIIDGMQRTAALMLASDRHPTILDTDMRVEFWLTRSVRAMVYRMLVLNTGQTPWTLDRQIFVVYGPLLREIEQQVPALEKLITPEAPGRRVGAGQYRSDSLIELYIAFSLRKTTVDTKEQVSDEFSRLDFVDNLDDRNFQAQFYGALNMLVALDHAFSRLDPGGGERLSRGRHIFDSQPARIGYMVALGLEILGRPGANRPDAERESRMAALQAEQGQLVARLAAMDEEALSEFLMLDVLREVLDRRVGQVGRYERAVFSEAFRVLIQDAFQVPSMEPCWRAN